MQDINLKNFPQPMFIRSEFVLDWALMNALSWAMIAGGLIFCSKMLGGIFLAVVDNKNDLSKLIFLGVFAFMYILTINIPMSAVGALISKIPQRFVLERHGFHSLNDWNRVNINPEVIGGGIAVYFLFVLVIAEPPFPLIYSFVPYMTIFMGGLACRHEAYLREAGYHTRWFMWSISATCAATLLAIASFPQLAEFDVILKDSGDWLSLRQMIGIVLAGSWGGLLYGLATGVRLSFISLKHHALNKTKNDHFTVILIGMYFLMALLILAGGDRFNLVMQQFQAPVIEPISVKYVIHPEETTYRQMLFSAQDHMLLVARDEVNGLVRYLEPSRNKFETLDTNGSLPEMIAFSPDGRFIAAGFKSEPLWTIHIWDQTLQLQKSAEANEFSQLAISNEGEIAYLQTTVGDEQQLGFVNAQGQHFFTPIQTHLSIRGMNFTTDRQLTLVGSNIPDTANIVRGSGRFRYQIIGVPINDFLFFQSEMVGYVDEANNGYRLHLWHVIERRQIAVYQLPPLPLNPSSITISPTQTLIAAVHPDGRIFIWDAETLRVSN